MYSPVQLFFALPDFDFIWPEFSSEELWFAAPCMVLAVLFALEFRSDRRDYPLKTVRQSYLTNTGIFMLNQMMMAVLSVSSLYLIADRYTDWGLLSALAQPGWKAILSFILLDFCLYLWHRSCHTFAPLWMLHKVHHSDRCLTVSTAFRLHFVELFLSTLIKAVFIVVIGVEAAVVLTNEAIIALFVLFHHSNIAFPGQRWLGRLIITPSLHRLHHSTRREEHDLNYGSIFCLWDRMFGTFADLIPRKLGLNLVKERNIVDLLMFGLTRDYLPSHRELQAMIAEAAYFLAEKRGFAPGCDVHDWIEAEQEIYGGGVF